MGTRADFYIQSGEKLEASDWLGSIAWEGYPDGIAEAVKKATTAAEFRAALQHMADDRDDWTRPEDGWPWPWETSATTDYAYVFRNGKVSWRHRNYPDMSTIKKVTFGARSGLIVISARKS